MDKAFKLSGVEITVNSKKYKVLMSMTSSSGLKNYLDDVEVMAVIKPAYQLIIPYNANISENSTFSLDDRSYTIRKITNSRNYGGVVCKTAICY